MIDKLLLKLQEKTDLSYEQIRLVMSFVLDGKTTVAENITLLSSLAAKGETDDELLGMLDEMLEFSLKITPKTLDTVIDMCGTGGDGLGTFNISTTASFVVAAHGATVAKHGNRSSSGVLGSADIFEYFGYDLNQDPSSVAHVLDRYGICFIFAQKFHPAMRHVSAARKQIGGRTAFNLLGPLSNPAHIKNQLVGVYSDDMLERLPAILRQRGAKTVMTVRSNDGIDEFSTSADNKIAMLKNDVISTDTVNPKDVGLHMSSLRDIQIKTKEEGIRSFVGVLDNTANQAMIETTALNAAGGLITANITDDFKDAVSMALETIHSGRAYSLFEKFVKGTGCIEKLEELAN